MSGTLKEMQKLTKYPKDLRPYIKLVEPIQKIHWCQRYMNDEDYEDSKLNDYQPYYAGDLTQK